MTTGRLERQLQILEWVLGHGHIRFRQVERILEPISTATVTRLLREMCRTGVLRQEADGTYRVGGRPSAWQQMPQVAETAVIPLVHFARREACTVTLWRRHDRRIRCLWRHLDEHSPALSGVGNVRPLELPVIGAGLFMGADELASVDRHRAAVARTPLAPGATVIRRVLRGCRDHGIYDDDGRFYRGSRRIAVRVDNDYSVGMAIASARVRGDAEGERLRIALRRSAVRVRRAFESESIES